LSRRGAGDRGSGEHSLRRSRHRGTAAADDDRGVMVGGMGGAWWSDSDSDGVGSDAAASAWWDSGSVADDVRSAAHAGTPPRSPRGRAAAAAATAIAPLPLLHTAVSLGGALMDAMDDAAAAAGAGGHPGGDTVLRLAHARDGRLFAAAARLLEASVQQQRRRHREGGGSGDGRADEVQAMAALAAAPLLLYPIAAAAGASAAGGGGASASLVTAARSVTRAAVLAAASADGAATGTDARQPYLRGDHEVLGSTRAERDDVVRRGRGAVVSPPPQLDSHDLGAVLEAAASHALAGAMAQHVHRGRDSTTAVVASPSSASASATAVRPLVAAVTAGSAGLVRALADGVAELRAQRAASRTADAHSHQEQLQLQRQRRRAQERADVGTLRPRSARALM